MILPKSDTAHVIKLEDGAFSRVDDKGSHLLLR